MPLNINWQQILLHVFNFTILFGALYFLLYGPVKKFMDKRAEEFRTRDEELKKGQEETEKLKSSYEEKLEEAEKEAAEIRRAAEKEAAESAAEIGKEAAEKADALLQKARDEAEAEHAAMLEAAKQEITDAALEMAGKILTKNTDATYEQFLASVEKGERNG